tara:strand:- start:83 stop:1231 length:1149 start_codon:yes stop_codon:yes gene_type:complete
LKINRFLGIFLSLFFYPVVWGSVQFENNKEDKFGKTNLLDINYLNKQKLNNYILETGDRINVEVKSDESYVNFGVNFNSSSNQFNSPPSSMSQLISGEGKITLPLLDEVYVENLSISELNDLLEKAYKTYIKSPKVKVRVIDYRPIKVLVQGEIANPGFHTLDGYRSLRDGENYISFFPKLFDVLREAGGITPYSDLTNIQIVRKDTLSNGGGKKETTLNFSEILKDGDGKANLRMYDSDVVIIKKLKEPNTKSLEYAFSSNLNNKLIEVIVSGNVNKPNTVKLSRTSTLNDALLFTGGKTITSGNIKFIRIQSNGGIDSRVISYRKNAKRGSYSNPYLKNRDLIFVDESLYGKSMTLLSVLTRPFSEILSTYGVIKAIEAL